jgi:hypothetical protein
VLVLSVAGNISQLLKQAGIIADLRVKADAEIEAARAETADCLYNMNTEKGRWADAIDTVIRRKDDAIAAGEWCEAALLIDRYTQLVMQFEMDDARRMLAFVDMMNKWHKARMENRQ